MTLSSAKPGEKFFQEGLKGNVPGFGDARRKEESRKKPKDLIEDNHTLHFRRGDRGGTARDVQRHPVEKKGQAASFSLSWFQRRKKGRASS